MRPRLLVPVLVGALAAAFGAAAQQPAATPPPAVTVVRAAPAELAETVFVTGVIAPREEVLIGPELDGLRIVELLADEGDRVAAGQVLARLSRETLDIQLLQNAAQLARIDASVDQAKAQIAQAEADAAFTRATLDRSRQLDRSGFASKEQLDQKTANSRAANARVAAAKEGLALALADRRQTEAQRKDIELRLARTEIRSPFAGIVSRRSARVGAIAAGSQDALFRLIKDGVVEIEADVAEAILSRLRQGQPATATPTGTDHPLAGRVRLVAPEISRTSRLGRVRISLETRGGPTPPLGAFARATIEIARRTAIAVPQSAVLAAGERNAVQVVVDGAVETRAVTLGIRADGRVHVQSGVREGEDVIATAGAFVRNGDRVTPVARTAAAN
jgi:RND family efflux transporter MFP subunit